MHLPDPPEPFILLDDGRATGARAARLYTRPVEIVRADALGEVVPALDRLRAAGGAGLHAAGYLAYEAGMALEPRLAMLEPMSDGPLLWFGLFEDYAEIAPDAVPALLEGQGTAHAGVLEPHSAPDAYLAAFARVQDYIRAGDIYQANLSFGSAVPFTGDPRALYSALRRRAQAGHCALMMTGERWLLSLSPELFFALEGDCLTTRPMKGTAPRHTDPARNAALARDLREDPKQRAENLMIVDLLRNDLSRIAAPGSVRVPHLFAIETYPTVHQMTSTVTARLAPGRDAIDVIGALFPCGSITGAPKLRAMEIIHEIEQRPRGPYCGAIGRIDPADTPDGGAEFNVAIRTISIEKDASVGYLGLGSGVVADSRGPDEWMECLDKARFMTGLAE